MLTYSGCCRLSPIQLRDFFSKQILVSASKYLLKTANAPTMVILVGEGFIFTNLSQFGLAIIVEIY